MAFVSLNPKNSLNPEVADNCIVLEAKNLEIGTEIIGYYKNMYTDKTYNSKCYVIKGKDNGMDYLLFGNKSLNEDMAYYTQGQLLSVTFKGTHVNKGGPFAGKLSNIWKVVVENTWMPTPDFISQLQQEVYNRKLEVHAILSNMGIAPQNQSANQHSNFNMPQQSFHPPQQAANFQPPQAFYPPPASANPHMQASPIPMQPTFVAPMPTDFGGNKRKSVDPFG